jgi:DNA-directed RNA polymerase subunit RPC12/RpoP
MAEDRFTEEKRAAATPDASQWSPGFGPLLLIVLCGVLLIAAIILGVTTGIGLLFAIPLGVLALVVAMVLVRGRSRKTVSACPHCGQPVDFPAHLAEFNCPSCGQRIEAPAGHDLRHAT